MNVAKGAAGMIQNSKKLKFLDKLSNGFYQNVGTNQVGISYEPPKIKRPLSMAIKLLMTPEKYFRYIVKLKPVLFKKNNNVNICQISFRQQINLNL